MKLCSKEALLWGGIYCVLATPLSYLDQEGTVSAVLFLGFAIGMVLLCFNKVPKFIYYVMNDYPRTSYYLMSIGWLPYFVFIGLTGIIATASFFEWGEETLNIIVLVFGYISAAGIPLSLLIAFVREKFCKKGKIDVALNLYDKENKQMKQHKKYKKNK